MRNTVRSGPLHPLVAAGGPAMLKKGRFWLLFAMGTVVAVVVASCNNPTHGDPPGVTSLSAQVSPIGGHVPFTVVGVATLTCSGPGGCWPIASHQWILNNETVETKH